MKIWMVETAGGPFVEKAVPTPQPGPGQVLVRVAASGVNPLDTKIRAGAAPHARQPLPAVLGLDVAGIVERVGEGVDPRFQTGTEVFGMVGGVGGHQGTLAQYVSVDGALLALKPKRLTMREAAAVPLAGITAWEGLVDRAKVARGKTALVHAAAGGVGHMAMQLAITMGAETFGTISAAKRALIPATSATLIDYAQTRVEEYVDDHTAGAGFDIIFDTVGGATLDASFAAVKRYTGHVVSALGWGNHSLAPLSFRGASYSGVFTLMPLLTGEGRTHHGEILSRLAMLADEGRIRPFLNPRAFRPEDLELAYTAVAQGAAGKVVIEL